MKHKSKIIVTVAILILVAGVFVAYHFVGFQEMEDTEKSNQKEKTKIAEHTDELKTGTYSYSGSDYEEEYSYDYTSESQYGFYYIFQLSVPNVVEDYARREDVRKHIGSLLGLKASKKEHWVMEDAFLIYVYSVKKNKLFTDDDSGIYQFPITSDGKIVAVYTVTYDKEKKEFTESASTELNDWLNEIDYMEHEYLLYALDMSPKEAPEEVENNANKLIIAETSLGNKYYEKESLKQKLTEEEKDFLRCSPEDKISIFKKYED